MLDIKKKPEVPSASAMLKRKNHQKTVSPQPVTLSYGTRMFFLQKCIHKNGIFLS